VHNDAIARFLKMKKSEASLVDHRTILTLPLEESPVEEASYNEVISLPQEQINNSFLSMSGLKVSNYKASKDFESITGIDPGSVSALVDSTSQTLAKGSTEHGTHFTAKVEPGAPKLLSSRPADALSAEKLKHEGIEVTANTAEKWYSSGLEDPSCDSDLSWEVCMNVLKTWTYRSFSFYLYSMECFMIVLSTHANCCCRYFIEWC